MRRAVLALLLLAAACGEDTGTAPDTTARADLGSLSRNSRGPVDFCLTLLHNNDGESRLLNAGTGTLADFGGVARFATVVQRLKDEARNTPAPVRGERGEGCDAPGRGGRGVLLLSSGDNFLAGPEFNASLEKGPPYYDGLALDLIGYDALAIGNHEFDFGPDVFANFASSFRATRPPFLSANLGFGAEPGLAALEDQGRIASSAAFRVLPDLNQLLTRGRFRVGRGAWSSALMEEEEEVAASHVFRVGRRLVGVVGATTPLLPAISSPRSVTVSPDVAGAIQREVDRLTRLGVGKIVVVSHLQSVQEDLALIPLLRGVDVVIAGGGDDLLANSDDLLIPGTTPVGPYPITVADADGKAVLVVTTEGGYRYVGRLIVAFDEAGAIVSVNDRSGPVRVAGGSYPDAVLPDPSVEAAVTQPVAAYVADLASRVVAQSEVPLDGRRANVRTRETNEGNLVADALLWQARERAASFGVPLPQVAFQNGGGIRNDSEIPSGPITELNTFSILPFLNFVAIAPAIPREQFKELLENAVSRVEFTDGRFAQVAGFAFHWSATGVAQVVDNAGTVLTPGSRVRHAVLDDGSVIVDNGAVVPGAPLVLATIDFTFRGGDQFPFRGAAFTPVGVTYQQALANYLRQGLSGVVRAAQYPVGGSGRITRLP